MARRKAPSLDVTTGAIWRQLLMLFFPAFVCVVLQELCTFCNLSFVGRYTGSAAYEAVMATAGLTHVVISLAMGMCMGCSIIVSHHFGAHSGRRIKQATHTALALSLVAGLLVTALGMAVADPLLRVVGTPNELMDQALAFAYIYLGAGVLIMLFNMGSALQRAVGDIHAPMRIALLLPLANLAFCELLVRRLDLGVQGAALATDGAYLLAAAVTGLSLMRAKAPWRLHPKRIRINSAMARDMLACALPLVLQGIAFSLTNLTVQTLMSSFGEQMAEAWYVSVRIGAFVWMVADALAMATITFSAQNFGSANYARMKRGLHVALVLSLVIVGCVAAPICLYAQQVSSLFVNDRAIAELASFIVICTVPFYLIAAWMDDVAATVRGSGEGFWPMVLIVGGTCLLRIAWMLVVVPRSHSIMTAIASYPITWLVTTLCFVVYYRHGRWITRSLRRARHLRADA